MRREPREELLYELVVAVERTLEDDPYTLQEYLRRIPLPHVSAVPASLYVPGISRHPVVHGPRRPKLRFPGVAQAMNLVLQVLLHCLKRDRIAFPVVSLFEPLAQLPGGVPGGLFDQESPA